MNERKPSFPDVRPPNPPWRPIQQGTTSLATITFYYGDAKSSVVPIRDISNRNDAKNDPNFETLTYGLFSICCKKERKSIVEKGITTQFFCTTRADSIRVLTGYYRPAWYCEMDADDYALAAETARFVSPGFALGDLVPFLEDYPIDRFFRGWKYIREEEVIERLLLLIQSAPDATAQYVSEIHRLETFSIEQYGHMYFDRVEGFSWKYAGELLRKKGMI